MTLKPLISTFCERWSPDGAWWATNSYFHELRHFDESMKARISWFLELVPSCGIDAAYIFKFSKWLLRFHWDVNSCQLFLSYLIWWPSDGTSKIQVLKCWQMMTNQPSFRQGCLCACPPRPVDLHTRPTRKYQVYSSIFEHIWVYLRYFLRIFREYV
jgi:hypothetical protein